MTRSVVALLAVVAVFLVAAPAQAVVLAPPSQAVEPLALTGATPADGAVVAPQPTGGIPWQIGSAPPEASVLVTISTSPATAADGVTLADENRVDFFFLAESPTTPGAYSGLSDPGPNAWSGTAATYYWQMRATWTDASAVFHTAASRIQRLVIGTAPPAAAPSAPGQPSAPGRSPSSARTTLAMAAPDATYYVRTVVRQRTRRQPRNLRYRCARVSSRSFRCRPSWRDSRNIYSATVTFTHARTGQRIVARGTFKGRRASRRCTGRRTVRRCGRPFRWRAVTAARPVTAVRSR
jgi:hypothetical protein